MCEASPRRFAPGCISSQIRPSHQCDRRDAHRTRPHETAISSGLPDGGRTTGHREEREGRRENRTSPPTEPETNPGHQRAARSLWDLTRGSAPLTRRLRTLERGRNSRELTLQRTSAHGKSANDSRKKSGPPRGRTESPRPGVQHRNHPGLRGPGNRGIDERNASPDLLFVSSQ